MSNELVYVTDKNYMFRSTVAIIRFYPKLYAKRRVFIQSAPRRNDVEVSSSTCQAKFTIFPNKIFDALLKPHKP